MTKKDTKDIILDAAEKLFAREGYHGTSVRAITGEAEVNLASVNYHFGSKEALPDALTARRPDPINRECLEAINKAADKKQQWYSHFSNGRAYNKSRGFLLYNRLNEKGIY